jgi:hypothetical protein
VCPLRASNTTINLLLSFLTPQCLGFHHISLVTFFLSPLIIYLPPTSVIKNLNAQSQPIPSILTLLRQYYSKDLIFLNLQIYFSILTSLSRAKKPGVTPGMPFFLNFYFQSINPVNPTPHIFYMHLLLSISFSSLVPDTTINHFNFVLAFTRPHFNLMSALHQKGVPKRQTRP